MVSGFKKNEKKIVFAKDKKQVFMVLVVFVIFGFAIVHMLQELGIISSAPSSPDIPQPVENNFMGEQNNNENTSEPQNMSADAQDIYQKTQELKQELEAKKEDSEMVTDVAILPSNQTSKKGKMITVVVDNSTNHENPFQPQSSIANIPKNKITYPISMAPPPLNAGVNVEAEKLMQTTVSGIMYDKYSPSAVIRIDDTDYLVKKNDIIKGYKILNITKDYVKLQLGRNIYDGYIGQLLTKSDVDFSQNISNLSSKFGGNNVTIIAKKPTTNSSAKKKNIPSKKKVTKKK